MPPAPSTSLLLLPLPLLPCTVVDSLLSCAGVALTTADEVENADDPDTGAQLDSSQGLTAFGVCVFGWKKS